MSAGLASMTPLLDPHDVYTADRPNELAPRIADEPPRVYVPDTNRNNGYVIRRAHDEGDAGGHEPQRVELFYDLSRPYVTADKPGAGSRTPDQPGYRRDEAPASDRRCLQHVLHAQRALRDRSPGAPPWTHAELSVPGARGGSQPMFRAQQPEQPAGQNEHHRAADEEPEARSGMILWAAGGRHPCSECLLSRSGWFRHHRRMCRQRHLVVVSLALLMALPLRCGPFLSGRIAVAGNGEPGSAET